MKTQIKFDLDLDDEDDKVAYEHIMRGASYHSALWHIAHEILRKRTKYSVYKEKETEELLERIVEEFWETMESFNISLV